MKKQDTKKATARRPSVKERARAIVEDANRYDEETRHTISNLLREGSKDLAEFVRRAEAGEVVLDLIHPLPNAEDEQRRGGADRPSEEFKEEARARSIKAQKRARQLAAFIIWKTEGDITAALALAELILLIGYERGFVERDAPAVSARRGAFDESGEHAAAMSRFAEKAASGALALMWDSGEPFTP